MFRNRSLACSLAVLVAGGGLAEAQAGNVTSAATLVLPGASTGTIGPIGAPTAPNNDNAAGASPNTLPYSVFFNAVGTMDVEFVVANAGGTTEYFVPQTLVNNTGQSWSGLHFELGYGVGASFVRSSAADALDFDTPGRDPAPTATVFTLLDHQADTLDWSGGSLASVATVVLSLSIDVPDNLSSFHPGGLNRFTLREMPVLAATPVPEPETAVLLGTGLLALVGVARKRKAKRRG